MKEKLTIIKVGGKIVEEESTLNQLLADFSAIEGYKLLVHGGGRSALKAVPPCSLYCTLYIAPASGFFVSPAFLVSIAPLNLNG